MKRLIGVVAFSMAVTLASPAWAARLQVHENAESPEYRRKAGGMLGRGLLNVGTFFMDLVVDTVEETRTGPPLVGTLTGVAKGVGCSVLRAGSGIVDVVTFWVPGFNGFPVSDSYSNCIPTAGGMAAAPSGSSDTITMSAPSAGTSTSASSADIGSTTTGTTEVHSKRVWKK